LQRPFFGGFLGSLGLGFTKVKLVLTLSFPILYFFYSHDLNPKPCLRRTSVKSPVLVVGTCQGFMDILLIGFLVGILDFIFPFGFLLLDMALKCLLLQRYLFKL